MRRLPKQPFCENTGASRCPACIFCKTVFYISSKVSLSGIRIASDIAESGLPSERLNAPKLEAGRCQIHLISGIRLTLGCACLRLKESTLSEEERWAVCCARHHDAAKEMIMKRLVRPILCSQIWVDGVSYELQEIYGIESNSGPTSETDHGKECVVCLSEPRDTTVLPCRHMVSGV